jgi:hypothetical protein
MTASTMISRSAEAIVTEMMNAIIAVRPSPSPSLGKIILPEGKDEASK